MRWWIALAIAWAPAVWAGPAEDLQASLNAAYSKKLFESATLLVGRNEDVLLEVRAGTATKPDSRFDLASLTKPFATALSVHALIDQGKLSLDTRVSSVLPKFSGGLRDQVTIADLLSHQSGLPAGFALESLGGSASRYESVLTSLRPNRAPGVKSVYSDAGFQILGLVVEKISGLTLAQFAQSAIYGPLGLTRTGYDPKDSRPAFDCGGCAPKPHDPIARFMYPRSIGHAGLYSSAPDLAQILRMLLRHGKTANGETVLSEASVDRLLKPYGVGVRSLGFDLTSEYSTSPRGEIFPFGTSFGHTGYTGTSVWADPSSGKFVILLTNRVYRSDSDASKKAMSALRKAVATLAAQL